MSICYVSSVMEPMATEDRYGDILEEMDELLEAIYKWDGDVVDDILHMIEHYDSECAYYEEIYYCIIDGIDYSKLRTTKFNYYIHELNKEK